MSWLDKLERKFGRYAIPNLINYIIILYGSGYVLNMLNPEFYYRYLCLDAAAVLETTLTTRRQRQETTQQLVMMQQQETTQQQLVMMQQQETMQQLAATS